MATIFIPTALRLFTNGESKVELVGEDIEQVIDNLIEEYKDLKTHLFTDEKKLRSFINIYVNDEDIREIDGFKTKVKEEDKILLIPSIAGGVSWEKTINNRL